MGKISRHTAAELKQLPLTLAKFLGGGMAVIGLSAGVFLGTRKPGTGFGDLLPYALLGISGIAVFILSSRALAKRTTDAKYQVLESKDSVLLSVLSWILFLIFAAVFLFFVLFLTR